MQYRRHVSYELSDLAFHRLEKERIASMGLWSTKYAFQPKYSLKGEQERNRILGWLHISIVTINAYSHNHGQLFSILSNSQTILFRINFRKQWSNIKGGSGYFTDPINIRTTNLKAWNNPAEYLGGGYKHRTKVFIENGSLIARFKGPIWGPSGADRTQVGPMLAPWTLLSGLVSKDNSLLFAVRLPPSITREVGPHIYYRTDSALELPCVAMGIPEPE